MSQFRSISGPSEGIYKEKGSKFISLAFPVTAEQSVEALLNEERNRYHDARHHCYAWILGSKDQVYRSNDDGEPSHSAGDPILGQIRAFELTNVLVIVIRYFGGIKLGVGGLANAYKSAARSALENSKIITLHTMCTFSVSFPYELTGEMDRIFNDFNVEFDEKSFTESCEFKGKVRENEAGMFNGRLSGVYGIQYNLSE